MTAAAFGLPRVPDLRGAEHDLTPAAGTKLTVVVPARDEGQNVRACLESLVGQDYPAQVIAVNDRSTDETGAVMEELRLKWPERLTVVHVTELPSGWLGKTHAMALGARQAAVLTQPEYLLFTDADVVFRRDTLRRALAHAEATEADHLVLMPTALVRRWDEAILLGTFQILGMWAIRPWRVADPKAMRDAVGVGAFNVMRRSAYERLGGFEALRMEIVEDMTLARRVKRAGMRQRIAFGPGMVEVHWAAGVSGIIRVMTKNVFSVFRFQPVLVVLACGGLLAFCVGPVVGLFWAPTRLAAVVWLLAVYWAYRLYGKHSGIAAWNAVWFPVGALLFVIALLNSMIVTLRDGGVWWRGTFYSLKELRRGSSNPTLSEKR